MKLVSGSPSRLLAFSPSRPLALSPSRPLALSPDRPLALPPDRPIALYGATLADVARATLTMGSDGAFDMKVQTTYRGSAAELTDYGTYEVAGAGVTFHSAKSSPRLSTGSISGNKLTANSQFGGIPFEIELVK